MKKAWMAAVAMALPLTGCVATYGQFNEGLDSLVGQPLTVAIDAFGMPKGEKKIAGKRYVQWGRTEAGTIALENETKTYATYHSPMGGGHVVQKDKTTTVAPVTYTCSLILRVSSTSVIENYEYDGDYRGCDDYIYRLNRYREVHAGK